MRTKVEFRSKKFPPYSGEEDEVNPGLWGQRLAEFLQEKLAAEGIQTEDIYSEDWGWNVPIRNASFPMWIGCSNLEDTDDTFVCFIEPSRPALQEVRRTVDTTPDVSRVADALDRILAKDPEISDVRWKAQDGQA